MTVTAIEPAIWSHPAAVKLLRADASREDWLAARTQGIGGSDIAALVGLSPWATRYGVYCDKVGEAQDEDNSAMEWGRRLEEPIAQWFTDRTGIPTRRSGLLQSKAHPLCLASIDRFTDCTGHCDQPDGILEVKATNWRQAEKWDDEQIPDDAELQTIHYLGVSGRSHAHVAVLVDGSRPMLRVVEANPDLFETLAGVVETFWSTFVQPRVAPPLTAHPHVLDEVKDHYPTDDGEPIVLSRDVIDPIIAELNAAKADVKDAKEREEFLSARLRDLMGPAAELWTTGELRATCKTQTRKAYTVKPASFRVLRLK